MISFQPTDEELEFTNVASQVADNRLRPWAHTSEIDKKVSTSIRNEIDELGFLSLEMPEDWEGLELPLLTQVQIMSALSKGDLGIVQGLPGANDTASFIRTKTDRFVLNDLQDKLDSTKISAFLDMEDISKWGSQLELTPQGENYILSGTSQPVRLACFADSLLIAALDTNGEQVVLWLEGEDNWNVHKGDVRLGLLASGIGRFSFDQMEVRSECILAQGEEATEWLQHARMRIYILQAAKEVGLMQAALDYATEYTSQRSAFGQEIAKFQAVSFRIANMAIDTRIANHLVLQAAVAVDNEESQASGLALSALHRAHRSVRYVTDSAVQLLGGHGYVQEFPVEKWMRDAEAQVALYGRERDFLLQRGEQIMKGEKEGVAT